MLMEPPQSLLLALPFLGMPGLDGLGVVVREVWEVPGRETHGLWHVRIYHTALRVLESLTF